MTLRVVTVVALGCFLVVGTASVILFLAAFQFRPEWFADPSGVLQGGRASAGFLRWGALADLLGYYLATGVVAIALFPVLRPRGRVVALMGLAGALGYTVAGGAGAAVLAVVAAPLVESHAAAGADQGATEAVFHALITTVFRAIWQLLDGILIAAWFLSVGLLVGPLQPRFGRLSLVLAAVALLGVVFNVVGAGAARDLTLGVTFGLWALWAVWLARLVWYRKQPFAVLDTPALAR